MFPAQIKSGCMSSQRKTQFWRASLDKMNVGQGYVNGTVSECAASGCPNVLLAARPDVLPSAASLPLSAGLELSTPSRESTEGLLAGPDSCLRQGQLLASRCVFPGRSVSLSHQLVRLCSSGPHGGPWTPPCVYSAELPSSGVWSRCVLPLPRYTPSGHLNPTRPWESTLGSLPVGFQAPTFSAFNFLWLRARCFSAPLVLLSFTLSVTYSQWDVKKKEKILLFLFIIHWVFFVPTMTLSDKEHDLLGIFFLSVEAQIGLLFY